MDATLIVIDSDAELARARSLVDRLMASDDPSDLGRLQAQARLIAAHEETKWPHRPPSTADLIRYIMDQHGLTRADLVPILGTASRVSEVLRDRVIADAGPVTAMPAAPSIWRRHHVRPCKIIAFEQQ